jgi:molybdenum cofactor biosynthesis protein B
MESETTQKHRKASSSKVSCGIITLSDSISQSNNENEDKSGLYLLEKLSSKYEVVDYKIIPDDKEVLKETIEYIINKGSEVIFTIGGTGISSRDITVETVQELFEKELLGFGEIFRLKTYEELGSPAIIKRATAGIYKKKPYIFHAWIS